MIEDISHTPNKHSNREELRTSLQILVSWFSADYINSLNRLFLSLESWDRDYKLPQYWFYVSEKLDQFGSAQWDGIGALEARDIYYEWITNESLEAFDESVTHINSLVSRGASIEDIKAQADIFMEKYLNNKYMWEHPDKFMKILDKMKEQGL